MLFNESKTILCLYENSGTFAKRFYELGYNVIQVDKKLKPEKIDRWEKLNCDVRLLPYMPELNVFGIISHPPCTMFSVSGAWKRAEEKTTPSVSGEYNSLYDEKMIEALSCVDAVLRMKYVYNPQFWFIENPIGTIVSYLSKSQFVFNPNEFAGWIETPETEAYTKKTQLFGVFQKPYKREVEAVLGSMMNNKYGSDKNGVRSKTPEGFAEAFVTANCSL